MAKFKAHISKAETSNTCIGTVCFRTLQFVVFLQKYFFLKTILVQSRQTGSIILRVLRSKYLGQGYTF